MEDKLDVLIERIQQLEKDLLREIQRKEGEFLYKVRKGKVRFTTEAKAANRKLAKRIRRTLLDSKPLVILTAPFIWMCLIPPPFWI